MRARSPDITPEARAAPGYPRARSGLERRIAHDAADQKIGGHIDEFFVVAGFLQLPLECVTQPDPLIPAEAVFPAEISGAHKNLFEYGGQALLRHHPRRIVGYRRRITPGHVLRQALGQFNDLARGKNLQNRRSPGEILKKNICLAKAIGSIAVLRARQRRGPRAQGAGTRHGGAAEYWRQRSRPKAEVTVFVTSCREGDNWSPDQPRTVSATH